MATVSMLDKLHQTITAAREATSHAGKAAGEYERARGDFRDSVFLPITGKVMWDGTGQPEASTVVRVHERAQETAALRLRQVEAALDTFEMALRYAQSLYGDYLVRLPDDATVHDDGWVSTSYTGPGVGESNPDTQWATELREILGVLDAADAALVSQLGDLTADPLPVLATAATPGILEAADVPYLAAQADGVPRRWNDDWTLEGNTRPGTVGEWISALAPGATPLLPYKGGGFIKGPDGRWYPVATPTMSVGDETYGHGDGTNDVGGLDEGWQTIDAEMGFGMLGEPTSDRVKGTIAIGVLAGGPMPSSGIDKNATAGIMVDATGRPMAVGEPGQDPASKPPDDPFNDRADGPRSEGEQAGTDRVKSAGGGIDVATKGLEAVKAYQDVDDDQFYTYRAEFQQNTDGRTRVVVTAYQATADGDINAYDVQVDADGKLEMTPTEWYDDPAADAGPVYRGGDGETGG